MEIVKSCEGIWREYQDALGFNSRLGLEETVKINNDFYNDRQWLGVDAPDLDKPCFNIIKPAVNYYVSQLVSDDIGVSIEVDKNLGNLPAVGTDDGVLQPGEYLGRIMQQAVAEVLETTEAGYKHRLLLKRMALDGDMALHSYFDPTVDVADNGAFGAIRTEIIKNTDIFFGNPATNEVERQPYIIIRQRLLLSEARELAKNNGCDPEEIMPDNEVGEDEDINKQYVTVLTKYFKQRTKYDPEFAEKERGAFGEVISGELSVHYMQVTERAVIRKETDLGYKLYPVAYASWEAELNNYHGVSPVTGKINNQIILNKMYALASLDRQNYSFPKVIYDRNRLTEGWNPDPGMAIGVSGDVRDVVSDFRPKDMSAQVLQLIGDIEERTKSSMGIYDAALGNAKPDNTSAILAVQQAAATPLDLQRQDFYRFVEANVRIWLDMMSVDYGWRTVTIPNQTADGQTAEIATKFNYAEIGRCRWHMTVDIGAAARWSELVQVQMLDNLLNAGIMPDAETYLECLPDGYLKNKAKLLEGVREKAKAAAEMPPVNGGGM